MKKEKFSYEMTDYPELYSKTYWGGFHHHEEENDIIIARNRFADFFKPKIALNPPKYILHLISRTNNKHYDHIEIYETKHSYIILNSPYKHVDKALFKDWDEHEPHYSKDAYTFLKVIPKKYKQNKKEQLMIDYSISKDTLFTKSLLSNNDITLANIDLKENVILFDGKNPHEERVIDFMTNRDESYKFIYFANDKPENGYESIYHTVYRYNTFYKQNIDIQQIIEYFKHN